MQALAIAVVAGSLALVGCSSEVPSDAGTDGLRGTLVSSGASSQESAQSAWRAGYSAQHPGVLIGYNGGGSGKGVNDFERGAVDFAASDDPLPIDAMVPGTNASCAQDSTALNVPIYAAPIAMIFHVEGVESLNLDANTAARIFSGAISSWNDPAIATLNAGTALPDLPITVVHRSDKSGTTENFTETLAQTAPESWSEPASQIWPTNYPGESAEGTAGVVGAVENGSGMIGYADASQAGELATVSFGSAGDFVGPTAEQAARVVTAAQVRTGGPESDLALVIDRRQPGYPFVLVSYALVCQRYADADTGTLVASYLDYVVSDEGQQTASEHAGSAPLGAELATRVREVIGTIS